MKLVPVANGLQKPLPYDTYCPSIKPDEFLKRICKKCNIYHPSMAALQRHRRRRGGGCITIEALLEGDDNEINDEDELGTQWNNMDAEEQAAPIINIFEMLANNPFLDEEEDEAE